MGAPPDPWPKIGVAQTALARKAHACDRVLAEARRLVRTRQPGPGLDQSLFRACELLDEMDEMLVVLHPARNGEEFAIVAALHRDLEQIQAAIPERHRARISMRAPVGERWEAETR